jgi:hypothetical protein
MTSKVNFQKLQQRHTDGIPKQYLLNQGKRRNGNAIKGIFILLWLLIAQAKEMGVQYVLDGKY